MTDRSVTFAPDEIRPEMIARLIIRDERVKSRDMAISTPRALSAPTAAPSRAANSGVNSTLVNPVSPYDVNRPRFHEPAQMIDSRTTAPGSTSLFGQMRTLALTVDPAPITTSLPITLPSSSRHPFLTVTDRHTTAPRRREFSPMYAWSQVIEFETLAPESMVVKPPTTHGPLTHAPARTLAPAQIKAGPSMRALADTSASSWTQMPSPTRVAGSWT